MAIYCVRPERPPDTHEGVSGGIPCLTLLVYARFSSNANNIANHGDPSRGETCIKQTRVY